jgi:hypothetical protein
MKKYHCSSLIRWVFISGITIINLSISYSCSIYRPSELKEIPSPTHLYVQEVGVTYTPIPPTLLTPSRIDTPTLTSTNNPICPPDLPIPKQTACAVLFLGQEELPLTPVPITPDPSVTYKFFEPPSTLSPAELTGLPSTPAGNGYLTDHHGESWAFWMRMFIGYGAAWVKDDPDDYVIVFPGVDIDDEEQGVITLNRPFLNADWYDQRWIDTPIKSGGVWIVDAVGDRLILESEGGTTFYFDVPSARFVSSLSEVVPSMTPAPTYTPAPTSTYFDDVSDQPGMAGLLDGYRQVNTDLEYRIEKSGDNDWFLFELPSQSSVSVILKDLPANFGFRVWRESNLGIVGKSELSDVASKEIILENLPADVYAVVVFGVDGAYDPAKPYLLRFEIIK